MSFYFFGIYFILRASQDIPKEIDNKTIDLMLSKPIKRWEFSLGKYFSHIISAVIVIVGVMLMVILGFFIFPNVDPSDVPWPELFTAFLIMLLLMIGVISTGFFFSTFLDPKKALVLGFGVCIFLYAIGYFWQSFDESMQDIKYISIFYQAEVSDLLVNSNWDSIVMKILFLSSYSIILTVVSVIIFNKRDIPI